MTGWFSWLTPEVRKALYGLATVAFTLAIAYGLITAEQIEVTVRLLERVIAALVTLMAFLNTNTGK